MELIRASDEGKKRLEAEREIMVHSASDSTKRFVRTVTPQSESDSAEASLSHAKRAFG